MTIAATSIDAYQHHRDSGKMGEQERTIFEFIQGFPNGMTRRQIAQQTDLDLSSVCGRVNTLVKSGHLLEYHGGKCPISRRSAKWVAPASNQTELFA